MSRPAPSLRLLKNILGITRVKLSVLFTAEKGGKKLNKKLFLKNDEEQRGQDQPVT